jgi:hypothetical protein
MSALVFNPQIPQITADYGGMSCRCAAIHAPVRRRYFCLTRRREEKSPPLASSRAFYWQCREKASTFVFFHRSIVVRHPFCGGGIAVGAGASVCFSADTASGGLDA